MACRCTVPEQWLSALKDTLHASRAERDHTRRMSATLRELLRESTNEFWQRANIVNNALSANIEKIQREKLTSVQQLTQVCTYLCTYLAYQLQSVMLCCNETIAHCHLYDQRVTDVTRDEVSVL